CHSVPDLPATSQAKARTLVERLTAWQYESRLLLVPFGEVQRAVVRKVPPPARWIVYRRLMVRIAEALAGERSALALATGESLGQVASQTLESIARIDEAATLPILRPLIGMDKLEITAEAQRIGTFEVSIEPDADCCTLFVPAHPATRMSEAEVRAVEARLDMPRLVAQSTAGAATETFEFPARARVAGAESAEPPRDVRRPRPELSPAHPCVFPARVFRYAQCTTDKPGGAAVTTKALRLF